MRNYRLLLLDKSGRLLDSQVIDSDADHEAMQAAEDALQRCEYVEIWRGGRPIGTCARPLQQASRLRRLLRHWRRRRAGTGRSEPTESRMQERGCRAHAHAFLSSQPQA